MMPDDAEQLTAYIDGELSPEAVQALEARLAADPALRSLHAQLALTVAKVEALPPETVAVRPAARAAVLRRVAEPEERQGFFAAWLTPRRLLPSLGLSVAVAIAVAVSLRGPHEREVDVPGEEELQLAQQLDVLENYEVLGLESADDFEVVAALHELEATP
ncbi:MAG: hypothetical protein K1X89_29675 [Myxococcaceae bacterium]|nr:hypothetical protein [Myxococcaceae bacterium]